MRSSSYFDQDPNGSWVAQIRHPSAGSCDDLPDFLVDLRRYSGRVDNRGETHCGRFQSTRVADSQGGLTMKWIALIAVLAFWTAQVFAEDGNYLLGPLEPADISTIDVQLLEMNLNGIALGLGEEDVERVIRKQRNKDGGIHYRLQGIERECEDRDGAKWCVYPDFLLAGYRLPLIARFSGGRLSGVLFEAPEGGPYRYVFQSQLAESAQDMAEQIPPTQSDADGMTWQGESIVVSIDWEAGKMMYIDTSAGIEQ